VTRANLLIVTKDGHKIKLYWSSDAYPDTVGAMLWALARREHEPTLENLADQNPAGELCFGYVGNPYYFYEVDQSAQTVMAWHATQRWVNAPEDWRARGWRCYLGDNGRFGYPNWVKGRPITIERAEPSAAVQEPPTTVCQECERIFPAEDAYTSRLDPARLICETCFRSAEQAGRAKLAAHGAEI